LTKIRLRLVKEMLHRTDVRERNAVLHTYLLAEEERKVFSAQQR